MTVDIGKLLHVLAHEIRTPSGIAQGYLRMLLEDRLTDPAERRRALEQVQKALARVSELTQESSQLANWLDEQERTKGAIDARTLIERAVENAKLDPAPQLSVDIQHGDVSVATVDDVALSSALTSVVKATARELRNGVCTIDVRMQDNRMLDLLIGRADQLPGLAAGPQAAGAEPLTVERGGVGLSLVSAAVVLAAHDAIGWTAAGSRTTVGIRLPLMKERAHQ